MESGHEPSNPYQAPRATFAAVEKPSMPPALLATIAVYLAYYALEVASMVQGSLVGFEMFAPVALVNGVYCLAMCFALWRRWQWARMWMVMTTALSIFALMGFIFRGTWDAYGLTTASLLLRLAVAAMLFLPSVRRWFAPKRADTE
jgi:hypothetical protein